MIDIRFIDMIKEILIQIQMIILIQKGVIIENKKNQKIFKPQNS